MPRELAGTPQAAVRYRAEAERQIARLYAGGLGVAGDLKQSNAWLQLAVRDGDSEAAEALQSQTARIAAEEEDRRASARAERDARIAMARRKEVGDYVCFSGRSGYVERISKDRIQVRIHHTYILSDKPNDDELVWIRYTQAQACNG